MTVKCVRAAILLLLAANAYAQDPLVAADRLHRAMAVNSIDDPQLKPWHLKLSFQLFDDKGKPSEQGTIEESWAGPSKWKATYTSPSFMSTEMRTDNGFYRSKGSSEVPTLLEFIRQQVIHPMPTEREITESKPDLQPHNLGKVPLDCVMLAQTIKQASSVPLGLFPTYCFDHGQDSLRISYNFGSQTIVRNRLGNFQGRSVVINQTILSDSATVISAHIETLETSSYEANQFLPSEALEKVNQSSIRVGSGLTTGLILTKVPSIYPPASRANHVSGTVTLGALIGTDGKIHSLKLISTPDVDLAISSLAAVRQWTYRPYLLNGKPVCVDTTITVNYQFH
jgi:TonB family protein